ncbi:MAG: glycosyltransferase, partial [Ignisphaera sp.]
LKENIKMLGFIDSWDLLHVYNAADVTVVPSYSEGGPLITPESLACGTPVIATDVGGNAEYLSLIGLDDLLISIESYDFSNALFEKILAVFREMEHKKTRTLSNRDSVPSWVHAAKRYIDTIKHG